MKLPTMSKRSYVFIASSALIILLIVAGIVVWHLRNNKSTKYTGPTDQQRLQKFKEDVQQQKQKAEDAYKQTYDKMASINNVNDYEKIFSPGDREANLDILLKHLIADKKYDTALLFVTYAEQKYPKTAETIDFEVLAYLTAKGLGRADLMNKYKQKTQATLVSQGVIKANQTLPDSYFDGGE